MKVGFIALLLCLGAAVACGDDDSSPSGSATPEGSSPVDVTTSPSVQAPTGEAPDRDLIDLARRYRGVDVEEGAVAREQPFGYSVGDVEQFHVVDLSEPQVATVGAEVALVTDHAYFFVEEGARYSESALRQIGDDFESIVYPEVSAKFGKEWSPGVDSDPRISILHANLSGAGGYFSGRDEYPIVVSASSNEREMLYLFVDALDSPGAGYNALVAHELQHLIHWNADEMEDSWVNEGLSEVAAGQVTSGGASGGVEIFLENPDTQLTFWPSIGESGIHYAASNLFFSYLLEHYGGYERARDLLAEAKDSTEGVDDYLDEFGTGFEEVFADWVVANYLNTSDGKYSNQSTNARVETLVNVGSGGDGEVGQYAADYLDARNAPGGSTFSFDGSDSIDVGVPDASGPYWWSNRGDGIDTRLTREIDLRDAEKATLRFKTWYAIEDGWDYGYVAVSTDQGETWTALRGTQTTGYNPVDAAYGPGYTGESGGWIQEEADLSAYAGENVLLRFEYITDDATNQTGLAIDDIEIPEIEYSDDASGDGDWEIEGFVRVTGPMEQRFIVQKIEGTRDAPVVTEVELDSENRGEIAIGESTVIVISGATANTAEKARYEWSVR